MSSSIRGRCRRYAVKLVITAVLIAVPCALASNLLPALWRPAQYHAVELTAINPSPTTIGISDSDLYFMTPEEINQTLDLMVSLGVKDIRIPVPWVFVQPTPTTYNWEQLDLIVNAAMARNMNVMGILMQTPGWAVAPGQPVISGPPADPETFGDFAATVASHYVGRITAYEVWNEPNWSLFLSTLSPTDYTELLQAAYPAIKGVDASIVVVGGVVGSTTGYENVTMNPVTFVEQMYAAGAQGYFDALSFHPYNYDYKFSEAGWYPNAPLNQIVAIRELMIAYGDEAKLIWVSEYGQPSSVAGEEAQAAFINDMLSTWKTLSYAGPVFIYTTIDQQTGATNPNYTFGIFRTDLTPKPAAQVIQQAIAANAASGWQAIAAAIAAAYQQAMQAYAQAYQQAIADAYASAANAIAAAIAQAIADAFNPPPAPAAAVENAAFAPQSEESTAATDSGAVDAQLATDTDAATTTTTTTDATTTKEPPAADDAIESELTADATGPLAGADDSATRQQTPPAPDTAKDTETVDSELPKAPVDTPNEPGDTPKSGDATTPDKRTDPAQEKKASGDAQANANARSGDRANGERNRGKAADHNRGGDGPSDAARTQKRTTGDGAATPSDASDTAVRVSN